ncbi:hypothetical protein [Bacillus sp. JCM 19034]|uniref:hypothetical protein n=1 Tax=Bacillus sp. JCM 19034 TaxID=1481928 RepID=UPI000A9E6C29|nr:hypothetical protein [Bacillus sp. JCM 19034]
MDKSKKKRHVAPIIIERKSKSVHMEPETMEAGDENLEEIDAITMESRDKTVEETDPLPKDIEEESEEEFGQLVEEDEREEEFGQPVEEDEREEEIDQSVEEDEREEEFDQPEKIEGEREEEIDQPVEPEEENVEGTDSITNQSEYKEGRSYRSTTGSSLNEIDLFRERIGEDVLIVLESHQLNILGQVFRPIFTGRIIEVTVGSILLEDVIIKMPNAPFFQFPTPLSFPIQKVVGMTRFDPTTRMPIL